MSGPVERPTFYEGQVLGAADLELGVGYARDALARHQRHQHLWGIVAGLDLETADRTTAGGDPYQEVTVSPGLAIDGTGRAIVVAEPARLSESLFDQLNVAIADPEAWYPIFLEGRDREGQLSPTLAGACETGAASRVTEGHEITFGRRGDEVDLDGQETVEVDDGPGGAAGTTPWRILLGFVQWDAAIDRFMAAAAEADGIGPRYAGVRAGDLVGAGGRLTLRSAERSSDGEPALELAAGEDGALHFGPQDASGRVTPVMTVDTEGNLRVTGKITGAMAGGVQVESGIASDGMLLPLPPGITQEQVDDGEVAVQVQVTPHYQQPASLPAPNAGERWLGTPIECRIVDRRVFCRFHWRVTDDNASEDRPGLCDYTVLAFPAKAGGGGS
jgi:hypothetical protein